MNPELENVINKVKPHSSHVMDACDLYLHGNGTELNYNNSNVTIEILHCLAPYLSYLHTKLVKLEYVV